MNRLIIQKGFIESSKGLADQRVMQESWQSLDAQTGVLCCPNRPITQMGVLGFGKERRAHKGASVSGRLGDRE